MNSSRDDLAAYIFPELWAYWSTQTGERARRRRQRLRRDAEYHITMAYYRSLGHSCVSCGSYRAGVCEDESDFYGTVRTKPTDLCAGWRSRS